MGLSAFLQEKALKIEGISYVASKRFVEDGKPLAWKLRVLANTQFDSIVQGARKRVVDPKTQAVSVITDATKLRDDLLVACVEYPNLADSELQNSYDAIGELDLVKKMLSPGELTDLASAIQQANGFDVGMADMVEEVKN